MSFGVISVSDISARDLDAGSLVEPDVWSSHVCRRVLRCDMILRVTSVREIQYSVRGNRHKTAM